MGNPTYRYKKAENGVIMAEIFDSDALPTEDEGWYDTPAKLVAPEPAKKDLIAKIKALGGKAGNVESVDALKAKLAALETAN